MKHAKRLAEIAARLKAASPQPWTHVKDGPMFMGEADSVEGPAIEVRGRVYRKWPNNYNPQIEADAVFIANAPSDIAWLLRRVEAALQRIEAHQCALPASVVEALNSGDGVYRP